MHFPGIVKGKNAQAVNFEPYACTAPDNWLAHTYMHILYHIFVTGLYWFVSLYTDDESDQTKIHVLASAVI